MIYILENLYDYSSDKVQSANLEKIKDAICEQLHSPTVLNVDSVCYNNPLSVAEQDFVRLDTTPLENLAITLMSEVNPFIRQRVLPKICNDKRNAVVITGQFITARIREYWDQIFETISSPSPESRTKMVMDIKHMVSATCIHLPEESLTFYYIQKDDYYMIDNFLNIYDWNYKNTLFLYEEDSLEANLTKIKNHMKQNVRAQLAYYENLK